MNAELYADGGLVYANPSPYGATQGVRIVVDDTVVFEQGYFYPASFFGGSAGNNSSEVLAIALGFEAWHNLFGTRFMGTVYTDSENAKGFYQLTNRMSVEPKVHSKVNEVLPYLGPSKWVLLDGHPSAAHLYKGTGKRGGPVSIHNVVCDELATEAGIQAKGDYSSTLTVGYTDRIDGIVKRKLAKVRQMQEMEGNDA